MTRTQIQFPESLYRRLKEIADQNDCSLSDVVRQATEQYVERFSKDSLSSESWSFPVLDCGGDYLVDPYKIKVESEAIAQRG